jgi:hypothetical protein
LYVTSVGITHKSAVKYINSIREQNKLKNLYIVVNGIDLKKKNGGYGYGYGEK